MRKSILIITLLVISPAIASESFSFLGGDMIDYNSPMHYSISTNYESNIIKFNEPLNEQQLKRYLIFGQGSSSELGNIQTNY